LKSKKTFLRGLFSPQTNLTAIEAEVFDSAQVLLTECSLTPAILTEIKKTEDKELESQKQWLLVRQAERERKQTQHAKHQERVKANSKLITNALLFFQVY
jgi:hypothetical protein